MKLVFIAMALCLTASAALAADMTYSAIALSPNTGSWGRAYDWATQGKAEDEAMNYCRANSSQPDDCRVVTWSRGVYCAALAVEHHSDGSVTWGSASGPTIDVARSTAYSTCAGFAGHSCQEIIAEVCSH